MFSVIVIISLLICGSEQQKETAKDAAKDLADSMQDTMKAGHGLGAGGEDLSQGLGGIGHMLADTATNNPDKQDTTARTSDNLIGGLTGMAGTVNTLLESAKSGGDAGTNALDYYQKVVPQVAKSMTDGNGNSTDDNGNSTDDNGNSTDDNGNVSHDNGNGTDDNGNNTDDNGNSTDDNGNSTDDNGNGTDDNGNGTDDNGNGTDDNGNGSNYNGNSTDNDSSRNLEIQNNHLDFNPNVIKIICFIAAKCI
ncbi:N66 matrix protein-like [Ctenocephalides felis]|uniref:N66 matrix protein-like n=1 Tax=Ctenocephalides felis TaxID=7515 RepID=UPI000E6E59F9|nr:N66 matrix protein-like [Ctenocephalides felis]